MFICLLLLTFYLSLFLILFDYYVFYLFLVGIVFCCVYYLIYV